MFRIYSNKARRMENNQDMQQPHVTIEGVSIKLPKNCKENRYYYRHREEILERKRQKRLEDPEYAAKYEERLRKKAEKEAEKEELERIKKEKRELRRKAVEKIMNPDPIAHPGANTL